MGISKDTRRQLQISDIITVRRAGSVALKRTVKDDRNKWLVTHQNGVYEYGSSKWAENKYKHLVNMLGLKEEKI